MGYTKLYKRIRSRFLMGYTKLYKRIRSWFLMGYTKLYKSMRCRFFMVYTKLNIYICISTFLIRNTSTRFSYVNDLNMST